MNTKYDSNLKSIYIPEYKYFHFKNHEYYLPFIGDKFEESILGKRILLIAESHYISNKIQGSEMNEKRWPRLSVELETQGNYRKTNFEFSKIWYSEKWDSSSIKKIVEEENGSDYYHTRKVSELFINGEKSRPITKTLGYPLKSLEKDYNSRPVIYISEIRREDINNFAFMNFFQRPALDTGESIKNDDLDNEISTKILNQVIEVLEVDQVFILSRLAYDTYINHKDCKYGAIVQGLYHPCGRLWAKSKSGEKLHNYFFNL